MPPVIPGSKLAVIGGGRLCKSLLEMFAKDIFRPWRPEILAVSDPNPHAAGLQIAKSMGIFTSGNFRDLYRLKELDIIMALTREDSLLEVIQSTKPPQVKLIDYYEAMLLLDLLRIEERKIAIQQETRKAIGDPQKIDALIEQFSDQFAQITKVRSHYSKRIRQERLERERILAQIIQGNTIPTFVINKEHIVTHWNRACEKLTGYLADEIVGTDNQWLPFRAEKRPIMADVIVDDLDPSEIQKYYGDRWKRSDLIEGAYQATDYFPHFGDSGKWLFFTAAPIKAPDGTIIGAIETLWDRTEERQAQEQREQDTKALAAQAQKLMESERIMTQIIQGSTIPTFVINKDHIVTHWNRAMERLSGFTADEIVGTNRQWEPFWEKERPSMADVILDQTPVEEIKKLYGAQWRESALIRDAYEAEVFFPKLAQNGRWCYFTAAPLKSPDGTIIGAIETLWDKTEDKKAEEERERHNRELSALCAIYSALGSSLKLDRNLRDATQELVNYLGVDSVCIFLLRDDSFQLGFSYGLSQNLCRDVILTTFDTVLHQVAQTGEAVFLEGLKAGSGSAMDLLAKEAFRSLAFIPLSGKAQEVFGVLQIGNRQAARFTVEQKHVLDLSGNRIGAAIENAQLHEQYRKSEEKYRSLFDNDPNPIFIIDPRNLEILDFNERAQECYGYSRDELLGMSFLGIGDPEDTEMTAGLTDVSNEQSILFSKKRHFRKGGLPFFVNVHVCHADYGHQDVLIASTTDITESIEKETQLIQASKMTTLGVMAAGMAHEINQPLNVIQVSADFLLKTIAKGLAPDPTDLKTLAQDIRSNVQRAADIIKHMRDFSRLSEGVHSKVDINKPIQDVFKVFGHQLKVHQVELVLDLDPALPPIMAEHNRLEQVFINLVTNAVDAMDEKAAANPDQNCEKRLHIHTFAEKETIVVTVSDTGTGMPPEVINKIFEPFFTTKEVGKGTGLGVSISYGIVKDYNGTIDIQSEPGKGTTFTLRFPVTA